jgi:SulP family sulfate permease
MMVLAPWVSFVPMAVFAGLLTVVAWNMAARAQFRILLLTSRSDAVVVVVTFLLVVFRDLTEGILVGFALGGLVFIHRMAKDSRIHHSSQTDSERGDTVVVRLTGPYFFGAAAQVGAALDQIAERPAHFILDLSDLTYLDSTGARSLELLARKILRRGGQMELRAVTAAQRRSLEKAGLTPPLVRYVDSPTPTPTKG